MPLQKRPSQEEAVRKLKHFCAYQERCHLEVDQKLRSMGVWQQERSAIISMLIEENYLNEERFAIAYAGGKFRMLRWGRIKIRLALKQKEISEYCIRQGLKQIDEEMYLDTLRRLVHKKWETLTKEVHHAERKARIRESMFRKGYESELVNDILSGLPNDTGTGE